MRPLLVAVAAATVLLGATAPLTAQAGQVANRVGNQQARINQGIRSGQLTRGEAYRDESHLRAINAQRRYDLARNGGYLTPREKANLNNRLNTNSNRIYNTKHNAAVR